ncbi:cyclin-dependent kinase inhibitor 3 family protein [Aliivibrio sp. S4TY2]|uniref:cyclin-dependent kinase inhibitor 3 family protein n=1 Tax=unclassified Aliivibrio TaxID=2645654 RepID=UPI0023780D04|nr:MULTISPECIES: cyclin-dependent kinase inhibitor 3 family protein [unclassified Aliivibrio]MDD9155725.1 cyclin-dependent kinase inhibitor 3 family protein [Aliivibrio sp. S4TY2]MDD9159595.1 cyclin-dependent kinase inhibitor 3 family protein [Aliivibrio sp. S4TY1]MDD9163434.1 cyclin-dependent kinase inhibitor 3 family protein [Aliivibrio sp. S4MY2]MDD9167434.1 cyclin-dependent kinase inhibitor 3 family protein [Aliivibrio sp. S4MY4]MDD9186247.1 cyclin-dependent kinase inhibitor 3 family prote
MTHPIWELPVTGTHGALILTPCPGTKGVELIESLTQLKAQGVEAVATALNQDELTEKGVSSLGEEVQRLGMKWFYLPIEDDCAPGDGFAAQWKSATPELQQVLENNGKVAMHCMGGSGRTGLLAAHLLLDLGWELDVIKQQVQALRPGAFTKPVQIEYIDAIAGK